MGQPWIASEVGHVSSTDCRAKNAHVVTAINLPGLAEGEIAAVIEPNGAGKSTLFNLITGHLLPTAGSVFVDGRDVTGVAPYKICGMGLGRRSSAPISFQNSPCSKTCGPHSSPIAARDRTSGLAPTGSVAAKPRRCSPR